MIARSLLFVILCTLCGESLGAATAACLAIDAGVPVQEVDYDLLRERLDKDGQVLVWKPHTP